MTFREWLRTRERSRGIVGDLADDVARDEREQRIRERRVEFPTNDLHAWRDYLARHHACDGAIAALVVAWRSYQRSPLRHREAATRRRAPRIFT